MINILKFFLEKIDELNERWNDKNKLGLSGFVFIIKMKELFEIHVTEEVDDFKISSMVSFLWWNY